MLLFRFVNKLSQIRPVSPSFVLYQKSSQPSRSFNDMAFDDIPTAVTPGLIKQTLKQHDVSFEDGYTCFMTSCPNCAKQAKSTSKLYINKTTGYISCASCLCTSQWENYLDYVMTKYSKSKRTKEKPFVCDKINLEIHKEFITNIETTTSALENIKDTFNQIAWNKFGILPPNLETHKRIQIRIDSSFTTLYFPLQNAELTIVGYKTITTNGENLIIPNTSLCSGVLSARSTKARDAKDTAVLVAEISDFIALVNGGISSNIVCLPNGLKNLPQHILPSLERYHKLILWFRGDINSWDSARNFSKKLGEKRCLFIRPTENKPLPHPTESQNLKRILASAQPILHKSITTFASLREDVLSDLQNIDKVQGVKWKRYPTLARILKGHRRGELTVITGPTGCGKTTFMSEYSLDLAMQGVNTLWGSFEIRNARLAKTMLQQMAGVPLDEHLSRFDEFAGEFEKLPIYFMTFYGQQSIQVVMEAVEHAQYVHDISHVVIDNLQFMMGVMEEERHMDRFWKQDAIIAAFRNFATRKNCHVSLVVHPRKERDDEDLTTSSIFGGAKASQEADNILIIQDKRLLAVKGKKTLQVVKNRYSGDIGIMPLDFDKNALSYAQKKKKVQQQPPTLAETPTAALSCE